jgi:hypothetical protein
MVRPMPRAPYRLICLAAALVGVLGACGGAEQAPAPPTTPRRLTASSPTISLRPGGMATLRFQLTGASGAPVPGAVVGFTIIESPMSPTPTAQGATLAAASGTTDVDGDCMVHLTAGLATLFRVRATSGNATADTTVVVSDAGFGSVDVAPFFPVPAGAHAAAVATTIDISFYDNSSCSAIDLRHLPPLVREPHVLFGTGGVVRIESVSVSSAIVGQARDGRDGLRALGCVDLPARTLVVGGAVQIALPLVDAGPDPAGTYVATSPLVITPPLAATVPIAAAWSDLTDCPLDPAQLWLDCTIDALGSAGPQDPLDCVPAAAPGGDGALGDALQAMRGDALAGPDGAPTACRGATVGGAPSLDAVVQGMFGSPVPATFVKLAAAAADAPHIFDVLQLRSSLEVRSAGTLTDVTVTHTLTSLTFGPPSASTDVALVTLGLPVLTATAAGTVGADTLTIGAHGFTLRLGSAARAAFGELSLARRGLPAEAAGVVAAIASLAHSDDGKLAGCVALDDALCPRAGRAAGCLVTACASGLNALAARLDASFEAANGTDLDLYLAGSAPLIETHDDDLASRLGDLPGDRPGTWTVDLRPRGGRRTFTTSWEAARSGNSAALPTPSR